MLVLKKMAADAISSAIAAKYGDVTVPSADEIATMLEYPPDTTMGDLAFPCFRLSRALRKSPPMIAADIASVFNCSAISDATAVNGYLNLRISNEYYEKELIPRILSEGADYGKSDIGKGKTVVLDYSAPNICKPFHIGHLASTVIGHSLKKIHEFCGYNCVGVNHLGDWGTQFGKQIAAYKLWGEREKIDREGVDGLVELYVRINNEIDGDEKNGIPPKKELADMARAESHKLEEGDPENLALWRWFVDVSLEECNRTYRQLGIEFDSSVGESFYTDKMPEQVELLKEKNLLKVDNGASIVDLSEYGMPPCLILRSDGSTLYPTRDIAAAVYRQRTYGFDKCIYVTASAQCLHFAQWFKVVELMGYDFYDKLVHVPYGMVSIDGAKLATRTGNVILIRDLISAAVDKVRAVMDEKNPDLENKDATAEAVGVGAIVFHYLLNSRIKDINFIMDDALSFDGSTGPYAQYTYARTCSILAKSPYSPCDISVGCEAESRLCSELSRFGEVVLNAMRDYEPSDITRYILDVCTAFNRFYHDCPIISATDENVRASRLAMTQATKYVLGSALPLICLKTPEKI